MLQTQRYLKFKKMLNFYLTASCIFLCKFWYLRSTSRRPVPPTSSRSKIARPITAVNYPSGTISARSDRGEYDSVLQKIPLRKKAKNQQTSRYIQSARPMTAYDLQKVFTIFFSFFGKIYYFFEISYLKDLLSINSMLKRHGSNPHCNLSAFKSPPSNLTKRCLML